jgi:hypothetical protein
MFKLYTWNIRQMQKQILDSETEMAITLHILYSLAKKLSKKALVKGMENQ